jgi:hypothetical protein
MTVKELKALLASMPDEATVVVACEHTPGIRYAHLIWSAEPKTYGGKGFLLIDGADAEVRDAVTVEDDAE